MIKLADSMLLAFTKLRTRKIRTIITVLLASLLFGVLVAASLVITGAFRSVDSFRQDGLTSRYIVGVYKPITGSAVQQTLRDPVLIVKAKKQYEQLVTEKTAEAKRLGLNYSQASDRPPYSESSDGKTEMLSPNDPNGIVHGLLAEKYSSEPAFDDAELKDIASRYQAIKFFTSENYTIARGSSLTTLKDGKEVFYDQSDEAEMNAHYTRPLVDGNQMTIAPKEITDPFILPNNAGWKSDSDSLPIILPQNTVEQLLDLEKLPDTASADQKLERLKAVREGAMALTFQACYRNDASIASIQNTILQQKEIRAHEGDKEYQKPTRIYALPDPAKCENPTVVSDTRSSDEKKQDGNQALFDKKFNLSTNPASRFISFKVVGVSPASEVSSGPMTEQPAEQNRNLSDIINNLLKTSGIGQVIPQNLYDQIPDKTTYADIFTYTPLYLFGNEDNKMRYVEFASAKDAQRFIDEQSCTMQYDNTCKPLGRPYQAALSFSNSAALDDIEEKASRWFEYANLAVIALATVIMWITIGRTIADGRHETAVFRAIGFKRIDIAMVYILYTITLSVLVALFATGLGILGAYIANLKLAPALTAQAQYGFGGIDLSKEVSLMGVDQQQLGLVLISCLATGLLSMVIPLVRNVRRSPIRDMREE